MDYGDEANDGFVQYGNEEDDGVDWSSTAVRMIQ